MKRLLPKLVIVFAMAGLLAACPGIASAQSDSPFCKPGYTVGFFNGVFNSRNDAYRALDRVSSVTGPTWNDQPVEYKLFYNQSGRSPERTEATLMEDIAEVMRQKDSELNGLLKGRWELFSQALRGNSPDWSRIRATIAAADSFFDTLVANLVNKIGAGYAWWLSNPPTASDTATHVAQLEREIADGRKLLLVAHSQGNLFVNAAYDAVLLKTSPYAMKVVHVAPASATERGTYTTGTIDVIIAGLLRLVAAGGVLPPNWTLPTPHLLIDKTGHTFLGTYLNPALTSAGKIESDIRAAMDVLEEPPLDNARYMRYEAVLRFSVPKGALPEPPGIELDPDARNWTYIDGLWNMEREAREFLLQSHSTGSYWTAAITAAGANGVPLPSRRTSRWCGTKTIYQWGQTDDDRALSAFKPYYGQDFNTVLNQDPNRTKLGFPESGVNTVANYVGFIPSQVLQLTTIMTNVARYKRYVAQPELSNDGTPYEPLVPDHYGGVAVLSILVDKKR